MVSSINGLNENSFLNSTLLLPNYSESNSKETQTNLSMADILGTEQYLLSKNEECYQLRDSNNRLKVGTYDWFNNNNEKFLFYTGLSRLEILCSVHNLLKTAIPENVNWKLSSFQQLVFTLMWLRLNLTIQDVVYRFDVSKSTVSLTFLKSIDQLYCRMKFLIVWPERQQLIANAISKVF